jgi:hypothetical protein
MSLLNNLLFEIQNGIIVVNTLAVTPDTPVMQPITLAGITMTINWLPVSRVTGYIVNFTPNINGVSSQSFDPTTTSASFTGTPGTSYNFTVTSVNGDKNSVASSPITITLALTAPIINSTTIDSDGLTIIINWSSVSGATGYIVNFTPNINGLSSQSFDLTITSASFTGRPGISYNFTVTSVNGNVSSTSLPSTIQTAPTASTGGSITTANVNGIPHKFHKFTSTTSSTFTVNSDINAYILVVGAGGGGGSMPWYYAGGGGGGGGEVFYTSNNGVPDKVFLSSGTTCTISVAATTTNTLSSDYNGNPSTCVIKDNNNNILINITAMGGCFGGGVDNPPGVPGSSSGSGGGGSSNNYGASATINGSTGTISNYSPVDTTFIGKYTNLAKKGGSSKSGTGFYTYGPGGGGGGAVSNGGDAVYPNDGGSGGSGYIWIDGNCYGSGGGGGGTYSPGVSYSNGAYGGTNAGKGGTKFSSTGFTLPTPGIDTYGGGGGGCCGGTLPRTTNNVLGGAGGSGVVIIAYPV